MKNQNVNEFEITLTLIGADMRIDSEASRLEDALGECCNDALLYSINGVPHLDFCREAESYDAALQSAIADVEKSGAGVLVKR